MNESHHNIFIHGVDEESLQHQLITTFSHDGATVVDATETSKYIICVDNNEIQLCSTVEPPNKGHIGSGTFVHCSEVVLILEGAIELYFYCI